MCIDARSGFRGGGFDVIVVALSANPLPETQAGPPNQGTWPVIGRTFDGLLCGRDGGRAAFLGGLARRICLPNALRP